MCGIVGYIGKKPANKILVDGLKRLEYRGYDSAGIVTLDENGEVKINKVKGKVAQLDDEIAEQADKNSIGIGHTRWATHGEPSVANAHPHKAGEIFLVHNGIIENYKELKAELADHKFVSDTDTEVLAALINSFYDEKTSLFDAVRLALKKVVGTFGIAVVSTREPNEIITARLGSPLIIGLGDNENILASDASALFGLTDKAIYLNDGEMAKITREDVKIYDLNGSEIVGKIEKIDTNLAAIQKNGYAHFLLKEIMEQPETLNATLRGRIDAMKKTVKLGGLNLSEKDLKNVQHVVIVGCGTAYYAGLLASYYLAELLPDVTIEVVVASEFRYKKSFLPKNSVALIVSQSGETADTLACLREIKSRGAKTIGVVNAVGSTIAREVDGGIYVHAGPEISVASTKAFTSQVSAMIMLGVSMAQTRETAEDFVEKIVAELAILPDEIKKLLNKYVAEIEKIATKYAKYEHAIYMGRDTAFPTALEGALKLKEISYIDANGYAAGELKHGPLALVDDRFFEVVMLLEGNLLDKTISNLSEVNARGGHVFAITNSDKEITAESILRVKTDLKILTPILLNVAQQVFAYYIAVARENDVDQPRNLAKSVTVE
ncbi:MAG: glutamine--fructose-6-phosphate transaminase (isomerizing) [Candidatus Nomurabacteria bacterium]|jgi:glucosamine--fructose-6-phosphate aminotransferase (isomerizing)|nr:glutamine--fructose-6-phosphate transaminase (isomerizing) [Candidatus Nomurabacteria bacterium]